MHLRRNTALWGTLVALAALAALAALVPASALAAGTSVSVRVEGLTRTLVATKTVHTHTGSITKGGAPPGNCPSTSAAGALDVATKGNWGGSFSSMFNELALTSVKGESWPFTQVKYYWGIWVDNRYATVGMCQIKLKRGDKILFAVDSAKKHEHPLGLSAPAKATRGQSFKVKVVWYSDGGKAKGLKGVKIDGVTTNAGGIARITSTKAGKLRLKASSKGYIRSAAATVKVR
jgi:hypothetical protein